MTDDPDTWPLIPLGPALRGRLTLEQRRELNRLLDDAVARIDAVHRYIVDTTGLAIDTDELMKRATDTLRARRAWTRLKVKQEAERRERYAQQARTQEFWR